MRTEAQRKGLISLVCLACGLALLLILRAASLASPKSQEPKKKSAEASSDEPLWFVDLHPLGFASYGAEDELLQRGQFLRGQQGIRSLDFVGDGAEVASFVTQEPARPRRKSDDADPAPLFRLYSIFLDAASGKVMKTLDWPLRNPDAGVFPRFDGSFIFVSTDRIILYSKKWEPVKELSLVGFWHKNTDLREITESPSGNVLMVYLVEGQSFTCLRILTDTLESREAPCEMGWRFAVSDTGIAGYGYTVVSNPINNYDWSYKELTPVAERRFARNDWGVLLLHETGKHTRPICECTDERSHYEFDSDIWDRPPQFVNDSTIFAYGYLGFLKVLTTSEKIEQKEYDFSHGDWLNVAGRPVRSSAGGQRTAFPLNESMPKGIGVANQDVITGVIPSAFPERVEIFDLPSSQWVYDLRIDKKKISKIWGLAISPNGQRLAIDSGGAILTYALPATHQ